MFDASPESGEEPRAVMVITIGYDGSCESELHLDPGDEVFIADALRQLADDIAAEPTKRQVRH